VLRRAVLAGVAAALVLALAGAEAGAAAGPGTLPNADASVAVGGAPRPLPGGYGFPVAGAASTQGAWASRPLLLGDGSTVAYLAASTGMCAGDAQECPATGEIQRFPAGGMGGFGAPEWTYALPANRDASQPVWSKGAIAFATTPDQAGGPYAPVPPVVLTRLSLSGAVLAHTPLPLAPSLAAASAGSVLLNLYPAQGGLLLDETVVDATDAGRSPWALEKVTPAGRVVWARPTDGQVAWSRGAVIALVSGPPAGDLVVQVLASATGRPLWRVAFPGHREGAGVQVAVVGRDVVLAYTPRWGGPLTLVARAQTTGAGLWSRTVDGAAMLAGVGPVAAAGAVVACTGRGAGAPASRARPVCRAYGAATGALVHAVAVRAAPPGSVVEPLAASARYVLVQVLAAPFSPRVKGGRCGAPMWAGCTPRRVLTEAVPWSGSGPVPISPGAVQMALTYDVAASAITVTGPASGWLWGSGRGLGVPGGAAHRPPPNE